MRFLRYWKDPAYWSWRWQRVSVGTKLLLGVGLAVMCGLGGYTAAKGLADATETTAAFVPPTQQVVTVQRTVVRRAGGETVVKTVKLQSPSHERVVTNSRTRTILQPKTVAVTVPVTVPVTVTRAVTGPTQTVTKRVAAPGRNVVVTGPTQTVTNEVTGPTQTLTNEVVVPGRNVTVTGSTRTVTNQVTSPGKDVTVTGPTRTVTNTVTQPAKTVTETKTVTTATTVSVTVTVPPLPPGK